MKRCLVMQPRNTFRSFAFTPGLVLIGCLVALVAYPSLGFAGEESELLTAYSLLIGYPKSSEAGRGSVLIVPGTLIPPLEGPGELSDKLLEAYQLEAVNLDTRYETIMIVDKPVEIPTTAPEVRVSVSLLGLNDSVATYRVVLMHAGEKLADTPVSVKRGGRAVVGSRDGDDAPYLFVVIGTGETSASLDKESNGPKLIKRINPVYPEEARREMIQGTVVLRLKIEIDGSCRVLAIEKSPHPLLTEAAREAVGQWRYEPSLNEMGKPMQIEFTVSVKFSLQ